MTSATAPVAPTAAFAPVAEYEQAVRVPCSVSANPKLWSDAHLRNVDPNSMAFRVFMEKFFPEGDEELKMLKR